MAEYITRQGDTWDVISKRLYGKRLAAPEINTQSAAYELNLPPWKRRH